MTEELEAASQDLTASMPAVGQAGKSKEWENFLSPEGPSVLECYNAAEQASQAIAETLAQEAEKKGSLQVKCSSALK